MLEICLAMSMHMGLGGGWNETHPCIRYVEDRWTVGLFINSESSPSFYASYTLEDGPWFAEFGLVTGYSGLPVTPMARVGVSLGGNVRLFAAPGILMPQKEIGAVLGIEYRLPFLPNWATRSH